MDKGFMFSGQRIAVDRLFVLLYKNMNLIKYFEKSILKIIRYQEYRGFDSGLRFYDEEIAVPCINEIKG
jgi:hypothetical protein